MPEIFVGRGNDGLIKYLSQVPSGLACQCTCLVCNGRLVARKGTINEWHFAHEGGQTHVDCIVGARNFLRKVAAEVLCRAPSAFQVKPNQRMVSFEHLSETILLNDDIHDLDVKAFPLDAKVGMATVVATGTTVHENIPFDLHVQVDGEEVSVFGEPDKGILLLRVPYPSAAVLHSEEETRQALAGTMSLEWQYLPNVHAHASRTLQSLQARFQDEEAARAEWMRIHAQQKLQEQARIARQKSILQAQLPRALPDRFPATIESLFPSPALTPAAEPPPQWVSHYNDSASLFCHRFNDGSYWLLGRTSVGFLLHPWPESEDGWDEALPRSVGVPNEILGGYLCGSDLSIVNPSVNAFSNAFQNTSDRGELKQIFHKLGWQ